MNELFIALPNTKPIFKDDYILQYVAPLIDAYDDSICHRNYDARGLWLVKGHENEYLEQNIRSFTKFLTKTSGALYIKMLMEMEKRPCSYHEIYEAVLKPRGIAFGNDTLLFKTLSANGLAKIHSIGKYKRKFYVPSKFGELVLDIVKKNEVAYKVLRHFMKFDGENYESHMMTIQFNPLTSNDLTTESFVNMLDAILNPDSDLHKIGSYAYWCQKLIACLKKHEEFYDIFNCPEINEYLEANKSNPSVVNFTKVFRRIGKKFAKLAA